MLVLDPEGDEQYRIEGYLPQDSFRARLEMAVARVQFMKKKFADAEKLYAEIAERRSDTTAAAEAIYWRASVTTRRPTITPCSVKWRRN